MPIVYANSSYQRRDLVMKTETFGKPNLLTKLRWPIICFSLAFLFVTTSMQGIRHMNMVAQTNHNSNNQPTQLTKYRKNCTLLAEPGTFDVSELPTKLRAGKLRFPKVIHRTWKDQKVPEKWAEGVKSCQENNLDFGYCHWTDEELEKLVATMDPWFFSTYQNYVYPIQRIDAVRYFILLHYGGFYLDLDYTCKAPLESALSSYADFDVVLAETVPTGVTNGFMASKANLPFWRYVVEQLADADRWYVVPYATVMFSTGPMYLSNRLDSYKNEGRPGQIGVIPKEDLAKDVLGHLVGNSWHRWDAKLAIFVYRWRFVLCPLAGVVVTCTVVVTVWCVTRRKIAPRTVFDIYRRPSLMTGISSKGSKGRS